MIYTDTLGLDFYKEANIVPYIEGEAGIGKTSIVEQYAKSRNMDCIIIGVASLDHIEFYGRTIATEIKVDSDNEQHSVFKKSIPGWVSRIIDNDLKGRETLLFIDELNRAELQNLQSLMNLILKREFGSDSIKLPESLFIVAAGNPSDTGNYAVETLDKATISRMAIIKINASFERWKNHFALQFDEIKQRQKIHPLIISYIENNRNDFILEGESDNGSDPGMDPRRWDMASRLLYAYEEMHKDRNNNLTLLLSSVVGTMIAPKLAHYIENSTMLTFTKIHDEIKEFIKLNQVVNIDDYLIGKKQNDPDFEEMLRSSKEQWNNAQPVTQLDILTSAFYSLKAKSITDDIFAFILKIASEEHTMSLKKGIEGADKFIDKIDKKFKCGMGDKISEGLMKHIEESNPFVSALLNTKTNI
jgi:hypothetical protein